MSCNSQEENTQTENTNSKDTTILDTLSYKEIEKQPVDSGQYKTYSNERFKDVRVKKLDSNTYQVSGKAQIFEANFAWVVEDGHRELKEGYQMTDAGAPEWGNYEFTLDVEKERPNSTLTLILFESSPKDGSRQYELPIPLD